MFPAPRRTQQDRRDTTRAALLRAGRELFVSTGFAESGTPQIADRAGVTRGALYHHFADKTALFATVAKAEAKAIADEIEASGYVGLSPLETLIQWGETYLAVLRAPGRIRLMLVEAPVVLDAETLADVRAMAGGQTLGLGLQAAGVEDPAVLTVLLSAAYDRAAVAIGQGMPAAPFRQGLKRLLRAAILDTGRL